MKKTSNRRSQVRAGMPALRTAHMPVRAWRETVTMPTYEPDAPDRNPMFLEKRVYQGSSGRVYPLPHYDRIAEKPTPRAWDAIHLENEYVYVMILPEMGGRIHVGRDKTNGYDFFYRQNVIKPALVGLAGPWCSGGVEFNWPQHHRPATFMPVDTEIERHADGSVTVWCSDHDPMARMKGMHGVCLHPGRSVVELKVRAYNRTEQVQTFLWWANVATVVHDQYQSFFPPDVHYVADHARRSMSEYPLCQGRYYGVDYAANARNLKSQISNRKSNDLSWYANIPVPTSYMCMGSQEDFFGGYDHAARAGVVHVANHHVSPGKKQWTWGNHTFGYAWDRNLTDPDERGAFRPYIEIMAGVYTDNQPDFSFLMPGETKTWSQFWYPIREIGPAQKADTDAALSLQIEGKRARIGVAVTAPRNATIELTAPDGTALFRKRVRLEPGRPFCSTVAVPKKFQSLELSLRVFSKDWKGLTYTAVKHEKQEVPPPATEPPPPAEIASTDELFITGLHLDQYRHATRCPTLYWREALRRDALDARCNNAMGLWYLRRGELALAEKHFRDAIARQTTRNANPYDGEAYYNLGICLRMQADGVVECWSNEKTRAQHSNTPSLQSSYSSFYKSAWNFAWQAPAYHALAELDCRRGDWATALEHLERSLRLNTDNLRSRNLRVMVLRKLRREREATAVLRETLRLDPLDPWARWLRNDRVALDTPPRLDLAHDLARAGLLVPAIQLLARKPASQDARDLGTEPIRLYTIAWLHERLVKNSKAAPVFRRRAAAASPDYCFPSRLEDIAVLEVAIRANPKDARAPYYLGNLLYDRRRHAEAIRMWEKSALLDGTNAIVWRNLGIGYFNIRHNADMAHSVYDKAVRVDPEDARLRYERDQLWKRTGVAPEKRLNALEKRLDLVAKRDDLTLELSALYNQTGRHDDALRLLEGRRFQPWEGGEGVALGEHMRTHVALGRRALEADDAKTAAAHFAAALETPDRLGESRHLLANASDLHYWLGAALEHCGDAEGARRHWTLAAEFRGDFQGMSVRTFSEMTYFSARSLERLGRKREAAKLLRELLAYAQDLAKAEAKIDYFATSLPTMLLFDDDLQARQGTTALFLEAQARFGLGNRTAARRLVQSVLRRDPNHALAADLAEELHVTRVRP